LTIHSHLLVHDRQKPKEKETNVMKQIIIISS